MSMEFISVASFYSSFRPFVFLLFIVARYLPMDVIFSLSLCVSAICLVLPSFEC